MKYRISGSKSTQYARPISFGKRDGGSETPAQRRAHLEFLSKFDDIQGLLQRRLGHVSYNITAINPENHLDRLKVTHDEIKKWRAFSETGACVNDVDSTHRVTRPNYAC